MDVAFCCLQAYYLHAPLPCERAPSTPLDPALLGQRRRPTHPAGHVLISKLSDYPVRGWVVEGSSLAAMAQVSTGRDGSLPG